MKLLAFALFIVPSLLQAQEKVLLSKESNYVKSYLVQYLITNGSSESLQDSSHLYTRQLEKISKTETDGVFSFGLMESHAKEYVFLRGSGEIVIINLSDMGESLIRLGRFLKYNRITDSEKVESIIHTLLDITEKNRNRLPFYRNDDND